MTDRYDEIGWGDASGRGRWHEVVGDILCVSTGVTMASLWAASCLACFFLPGAGAHDRAGGAVDHDVFTELR